MKVPSASLMAALCCLIGFAAVVYWGPKPTHDGGGITSTLITSTGSDPCPKEAYTSVLNKLQPVLGMGEIRYNGEMTVNRLDQEDSDIACIREWAKSIKDSCIQGHYNSWLDFYAGQSKEFRRKMLVAGSVESDSDKYMRGRMEEARKVKAYEAAHDVPAPPSCERSLVQVVKP